MKISEKPRVRFAPSPTGELHLGNARTALLNWLFARHHGGDFILRIEDTDRSRTSEAFEKRLLEDLKWLSLDWDEGPEKDGPVGPYHQMERLDIYGSYLKKLIAGGNVYPCYCTEEELEAERAGLLSRKMTPRYTGRCRYLTDEERKKRGGEGRRPAFRFQVIEGLIEFSDLIRGKMRFNSADIGDFIIVRSNGIPAYNFAVVIDDYLMRITHVIRGEDHLSNTAMQLILYKALGFAPPFFAHHALLLAKDHTKLSKRHGPVSVREFRNNGILPDAMANYLFLLGSSTGKNGEVYSLPEIIRDFSLAGTGKGGAIFDEDKLKWLNGIHIRRYEPQKLTEALAPFIEKAGYDYNAIIGERLYQVIEAVRGNLMTLSEVGDYLEMFFDENYRFSEEAARLLEGNDATIALNALREALNHKTDGDLYREVIHAVREKTGLGGKKLFMPLRAAITGRLSGPELEKVFAILGRASIMKRVERAEDQQRKGR
ncbi:MAG: glutamate--tRNA ligase [Syntrophales bacterium]|nr:glutamate--tRNA ligase [Syntrophales bacterium]